IRKRVLEYDDVMNEQRRIVYAYRDQILEGEEMGNVAREKLEDVIRRLVDEYTPGDFIEEWDLQGLADALDDLWPSNVDVASMKAESVDREELVRLIHEDAVELYDERERELGEDLMRQLERVLLLDIIDRQWREHLYDMDYLREGIHLRGFAQIDPLVAYKNEAYELFTELMTGIWTRFAHQIFNVELEFEGENGARGVLPPPRRSAPGTATGATRVTYSGGVGAAQPSALAAAAGSAAMAPEGYSEDGEPLVPVVEQRRVAEEEQIGRNEPCWCGSGKKFKKCHGA
ncbi:MAG TPA: SEC-C metal-binding domain-containing protein, partial [Solirubrobacteraceae bacterium]|nr:SEC-C metal-binding domain-containing protein [Solirubrobacteraceae bacterium]